MFFSNLQKGEAIRLLMKLEPMFCLQLANVKTGVNFNSCRVHHHSHSASNHDQVKLADPLSHCSPLKVYTVTKKMFWIKSARW